MGASGLVIIIGFWYIYYYFYILIGGDVCLGFWLGLISDWSGIGFIRFMLLLYSPHLVYA